MAMPRHHLSDLPKTLHGIYKDLYNFMNKHKIIYASDLSPQMKHEFYTTIINPPRLAELSKHTGLDYGERGKVYGGKEMYKFNEDIKEWDNISFRSAICNSEWDSNTKKANTKNISSKSNRLRISVVYTISPLKTYLELTDIKGEWTVKSGGRSSKNRRMDSLKIHKYHPTFMSKKVTLHPLRLILPYVGEIPFHVINSVSPNEESRHFDQDGENSTSVDRERNGKFTDMVREFQHHYWGK